MFFFAHTDEPTSATSSLLDNISHQPAWIAFLVCFFVLFGWFAILGLFNVKLITRILALLPVVIALALLFFRHNQAVASVLLFGGFMAIFALAFAMLRAGK